MKPTYIRRIRRKPAAAKDNPAFRKEGKENTFFGETTQDTFFQPAPAVQRKCDKCEEEEKTVRRLPEKKEEEEKKVQRMTDKKEEEEKKVHRKEATAQAAPAVSTGAYLNNLQGKGQALPPQAQQFFGSRMGHDFSDVRIHTGTEAAQSAKNINAQAYTYQNHIVFNEGKYNAESAEGKKLLAHELTHVVQQGTTPLAQTSVNRKVEYNNKGAIIYDVDIAGQVVQILNGVFSFVGETQMVVNGTTIQDQKQYTGKDNPLKPPSISNTYDAKTQKFTCLINAAPHNKISYIIRLPVKKLWKITIGLDKLAKMDEDIKTNNGAYFFKNCKNKTIDFYVDGDKGLVNDILIHEQVHATHVGEAVKTILEPWDSKIQSALNTPSSSSTKEGCEKGLNAGIDHIDTVLGDMITYINTKGHDFHKTAAGGMVKVKSVKSISCNKLEVTVGY